MKGKRVNDDLLRKLWPSHLSDKELAEAMGHHRSVIRRRAEAIGLPSSRRSIWSAQARAALIRSDALTAWRKSLPRLANNGD